jgi:hypothetical protein
MRITLFCGLSALAISSLSGCGGTDGTMSEEEANEESVGETSAALTNGTFRLYSFQDQGKCIGVRAGTPTVGTDLILWDCDGSSNQAWSKDSPFGGQEFIRLRNKVALNRCLFNNGGNGNTAFINVCNDTWNQEGWKVIPMFSLGNGDECFRLDNKAGPGKVLSVLGGKVQNGERIGIWYDFGGMSHTDQVWCAGNVQLP